MAIKRVTMQDIADACGLSRNTVSKVFNGRGSVPETTQKLILDKAIELGYLQPPQEPVPDTSSAKEKNIAILCRHKLLSHVFGSKFFPSFSDQISRLGYSLRVFELSDTEISENFLPSPMVLEDTCGILAIEIFDKKYLDMICSLRIPTLIVDGYFRAATNVIQCDWISMENFAAETTICRKIVSTGARSFGFVGDIYHCNSFFERYAGMRQVMAENSLPYDPALCILEKDGSEYSDINWLTEQLDAMPELPDVFVCANDFLAIHLMTALKKKGVSIPGDIQLVGFDGSLEASLMDPPLTTAQIFCSEIGRISANILNDRILNPDLPYRQTYVRSVPIWGNSTR